MSNSSDYSELGVGIEDMVATVEIRRPPHNFFDRELIRQLATAFEALDDDASCRAIVLAAEGKSFCAGADLGDCDTLTFGQQSEGDTKRYAAGDLYREAVRLFAVQKPIIGAIHGPAVGGGLGLAMVPDLRVACPESRFVANFTKLGFHPGFGLTVTLPELIGQSQAALMFYTSRRIKGEEALSMGLADVLVPRDEVRATAHQLAREIAECSPLGVMATRANLRRGLADRVREATDRELAAQTRLKATHDFKEGVAAMAERRLPNFEGR